MPQHDPGAFFSYSTHEPLGATDSEWWNWTLEVIDVVCYLARVLGLAVMSAGAAIASAVMLANAEAARYGQVTLIVSALFAIGFVVAVLRYPSRR